MKIPETISKKHEFLKINSGEWYMNQLENDDYKRKIYHNLLRLSITDAVLKENTYSDLPSFLVGMFEWSETPEGDNFWSIYHKGLYEKWNEKYIDDLGEIPF